MHVVRLWGATAARLGLAVVFAVAGWSKVTDSMVAQEKIALVYHPIAILDDRTNPSGYSTRAAAAAACAADGNKYNTDTAAGKNIQGTPTVLVNGKQIQNTVNALQQAVG